MVASVVVERAKKAKHIVRAIPMRRNETDLWIVDTSCSANITYERILINTFLKHSSTKPEYGFKIGEVWRFMIASANGRQQIFKLPDRQGGHIL